MSERDAQGIYDWVQKDVVGPVEAVGKAINKVPLPDNRSGTVRKLDREADAKLRKEVADSFARKTPGGSKGTMKRGKKPATRKKVAYKR